MIQLVEIPLLLIMATVTIESGGNEKAIGDNGRSWGCMQIGPLVIDDVNGLLRRSGQSYRYEHRDAFSRQKSREIFALYMTMWATPERLGRKPTLEDMARIWNGGPNGFESDHTRRYWAKISSEIERMKSAGWDAPRVRLGRTLELLKSTASVTFVGPGRAELIEDLTSIIHQHDRPKHGEN